MKWRPRTGAERSAEPLQETIASALIELVEKPQVLRQVNVDTTVPAKDIAYLTDSKLLCTAIMKPARAVRQRGLRLGQSYVRVTRRASIQAGRYAHARQFRRMRRKLRRPRAWLGRVLCDLRRRPPLTAPTCRSRVTRRRRLPLLIGGHDP